MCTRIPSFQRSAGDGIQKVDDVSTFHATDGQGPDLWNCGCRDQIVRVTSAAEGRLCSINFPKV